MTSPAFTQTTFRLRNDNGSESGATWKAAENTNATIDTGQNFRVRFRIDETNSRAWTSKTWNLYYSLNSGAWTAVTGSTPVQFSLSGYFTDGDDCTSQLSGGSGTFVTDNNGMKETTGGAVNSGSAGYLFETEWCLKFDGSQLADNDNIQLRIYDGSTAITYSNVPSITVNLATQQYTQDVSGSITTLTGAISKQDRTSMSGSITTLTGAMSKQARTSMSGSISTITGSMGSLCQKALTGSVSLAGSLYKETRKALSGSITTITGAIASSKVVFKSLEGFIW